MIQDCLTAVTTIYSVNQVSEIKCMHQGIALIRRVIQREKSYEIGKSLKSKTT